jgi:hypothetical protein
MGRSSLQGHPASIRSRSTVRKEKPNILFEAREWRCICLGAIRCGIPSSREMEEVIYPMNRWRGCPGDQLIVIDGRDGQYYKVVEPTNQTLVLQPRNVSGSPDLSSQVKQCKSASDALRSTLWLSRHSRESTRRTICHEASMHEML